MYPDIDTCFLYIHTYAHTYGPNTPRATDALCLARPDRSGVRGESQTRGNMRFPTQRSCREITHDEPERDLLH